MRNIKLVLAYDGTEYHGWGRQKQQRTLQQTIEEAIGSLTGTESRVYASGRTDTGVHALGQVINFRTAASYSPATILRALNAKLPDDIVVRSAEEVPPDFHANHDTRGKLYRYVIYDGRPVDPFVRRYAFHAKVPLDAEAMHRASRCLLGKHDFHSFETEWPNRATSVRTVTHVAVFRSAGWHVWQPESLCAPTLASAQQDGTGHGAQDFICIEVEADGFLYNMVRTIAGTLINVGRGYWPESKVAEVLAAEDRSAAGPTAPACGLFLVRVDY